MKVRQRKNWFVRNSANSRIDHGGNHVLPIHAAKRCS